MVVATILQSFDLLSRTEEQNKTTKSKNIVAASSKKKKKKERNKGTKNRPSEELQYFCEI